MKTIILCIIVLLAFSSCSKQSSPTSTEEQIASPTIQFGQEISDPFFHFVAFGNQDTLFLSNFYLTDNIGVELTEFGAAQMPIESLVPLAQRTIIRVKTSLDQEVFLMDSTCFLAVVGSSDNGMCFQVIIMPVKIGSSATPGNHVIDLVSLDDRLEVTIGSEITKTLVTESAVLKKDF